MLPSSTSACHFSLLGLVGKLLPSAVTQVCLLTFAQCAGNPSMLKLSSQLKQSVEISLDKVFRLLLPFRGRFFLCRLFLLLVLCAFTLALAQLLKSRGLSGWCGSYCRSSRLCFLLVLLPQWS